MSHSRGDGVVAPWRLTLAAAAIVGYAGAYLLLTPTLGAAATYLSALPVIVIAWGFGLRAGALAGLALFALNILLARSFGPLDWRLVFRNGIPGTVILVLIGGVVGWLQDLQRRFRLEAAERRRAEANCAPSSIARRSGSRSPIPPGGSSRRTRR